MIEAAPIKWEKIDISEKFPGLDISEFVMSEDSDGSFIFGSLSEQGNGTGVAAARYSLDTEIWSISFSPVIDDEAIDSFLRRNGQSIVSQMSEYLNSNFPQGPNRS